MPRLCTVAFTTALVIVVGARGSHTLGAQEQGLEEQVDEIFAPWNGPESPGCAVSIMRDGAIVYSRGYGMANLEYMVPITPASIFHVASVSKQFTAFAVALLAEDGKLSLDDDVRTHVPEVPDFGKTITVRHLIHHTSGLRDQWSLLRMAGWRFEGDVVTQKDVLDLTSRQTALNFEPGAEHLYSNTGYTLLGVIVERISGQSLREFTQERIFDPLGMTNTHFHDDHRMIVKNRAYAYGTTGDDDTLKTRIPDFDVVGATSLFTTVEDLARWDRNFYTGQVGGRALIDQAHTRGVLNGGQEISYAHALVHGTYRSLRTVGHGGADAGYRSSFVRFPDQRLSIALLCNFPSSDPGDNSRQVADIYLADALAARVDESDPEGVELPEADIERIVGAYRQPFTDLVLIVDRRDGKLVTGSSRNARRAFIPLGDGRFRRGGSSQVVTVKPDGPDGAPRLRISTDTGDLVYDWAAFADPSADDLAEYAGQYYSAEVVTDYQVRVEGGSLILAHRKLDDRTLEPTFADGFVVSNQGSGVTFVHGRAGRVSGFTMSSGRVRKVRFERVLKAEG